MHYYEVAPNRIFRSGIISYTFASDMPLPVGQIVMVEIGKRQSVGVVIDEVAKPSYATKQIICTIEARPLPEQLIKLALWLSDYYATPLANVLQTILPRGVQKKRRSNAKTPASPTRHRTNILFTNEQAAAIDILTDSAHGTFLLHGVTGSGKTEVYIDLARRTLADSKSVIVLVPEISLTPQLIAEFSNHFENLLVTHSRMSESARHGVWSKALNSTTPCIVIGPRSALFTPLQDIGAIIIDEAHEPSYKQDQSPKYSALRAASMLGAFHKAKVILGSATPNIIDRYLAEQSKRPVIQMTKPARTGTVSPTISLVDMTNRGAFINHRFISDILLDQISKTLADKKQVLIFHNRRGSASITMCKSCGWIAYCPSCFIPLILHADRHQLRCHTCGYHTDTVPTSCPVCHDADIIHKGIGTKLIEHELYRLFPNAKIARFDNDSKDKKTVNENYDNLYSGKIDIIIGTQTVAKGLDLPNLRMVGVIQADAGLSLPDYLAEERVFQLLAQVVGRVGRDKDPTQVIVQTFLPSHPSIVHGLAQDYASFYKYALEKRRQSHFPPFCHLLKLTCTYKTEAAAIRNSRALAHRLAETLGNKIQILGPAPAFYERQNGSYRWQLTLKSPRREYLIDATKLLPPSYWQYDLDPTSLL